MPRFAGITFTSIRWTDEGFFPPYFSNKSISYHIAPDSGRPENDIGSIGDSGSMLTIYNAIGNL